MSVFECGDKVKVNPYVGLGSPDHQIPKDGLGANIILVEGSWCSAYWGMVYAECGLPYKQKWLVPYN